MHQYGPFLVIVPLSTIAAWQSQFQSWAPDLNVITYIGTAAAREVIRKYEFGSSSKKLKLNVLLTTYELTLRDAKELCDIKWQVLAVDEVRIPPLSFPYHVDLIVSLRQGASPQEF